MISHLPRILPLRPLNPSRAGRTLLLGALPLALFLTPAQAQQLSLQAVEPFVPGSSGWIANVVPSGQPTGASEEMPGELALSIQPASPPVGSSGAIPVHSYLIPYSSSQDAELRVQLFSGGRFLALTGQAELATGDVDRGVDGVRSVSAGSGLAQVAPFPAANSTGTLLVVVNPRVRAEGAHSIGSRVWRILDDATERELFASLDRWVRAAAVEESGRLVAVATAMDGDDAGRRDRVLILDPHGNELASMEPEMAVRRVTFTPDLAHVLVLSQRRVSIYGLPGGDRVGSASMSGEVIDAHYDPDANLLVALTTESVTVVDLARRVLRTEPLPGGEITGEERENLLRTSTFMDPAASSGVRPVSGQPAATTQTRISMERFEGGRYRITGLDGRDVIVRYSPTAR